jgi:hypothetical protein
MRKSLPETMFTNAEQSRLTMLRNWVLDNEVTQIAMKERQLWNMPVDAQKCLGVFDKQGPGTI